MSKAKPKTKAPKQTQKDLFPEDRRRAELKDTIDTKLGVIACSLRRVASFGAFFKLFADYVVCIDLNEEGLMLVEENVRFGRDKNSALADTLIDIGTALRELRTAQTELEEISR